MKEYVLSVNNFLDPIEFDGNDALMILIYRILILQAGTNPLHPSMGVGIGTTYKYITTDDISTLQNVIETQLETYIPSINTSIQADLEFNEDNQLVITIIIDGSSFVLDTSLLKNETVYLSDI